jgi:hypothetical protein
LDLDLDGKPGHSGSRLVWPSRRGPEVAVDKYCPKPDPSPLRSVVLRRPVNLPQPLIQLICVVFAPQMIPLPYDVLNRIVILSGAVTKRSAVTAQSKDPVLDGRIELASRRSPHADDRQEGRKNREQTG